MADTVSSNVETRRCPVCLAHMQVRPEHAPAISLKCPACHRFFPVNQLLPLTEAAQDEQPQVDSAPVPPGSATGWALACLMMLALVTGVTEYAKSLDGPEFLVVFGVAAVALLLGSVIIRHTWRDLWGVSLLAFLTFEAIGVARLVMGYQAGMRKFGILVLMMMGVGLLFFVRARTDRGYGLFGSCAAGCGSFGGGCGGSSCGGGGGCGGGCGGCGG